MPTVELVYELDCPNVARTRAQLMTAFARAEVVPRWSEYLSSDPETPRHARGYASPTILVAGRDAFGTVASEAPCCRVYRDADGKATGVPPIDPIVAALRRADADGAAVLTASRWRRSLAVLPAVGAALLPKVACPACWPAYAGVLGAVGLGFLMETAVLLPLTALFLGLAVGVLAFRARRRRGYHPFVVGTIAATIVLIGKFSFESDAAMYAGLGLLVVASLWNSWPQSRKGACPACPTSG